MEESLPTLQTRLAAQPVEGLTVGSGRDAAAETRHIAQLAQTDAVTHGMFEDVRGEHQHLEGGGGNLHREGIVADGTYHKPWTSAPCTSDCRRGL